ncbi:MAG TPA: type II toxin-antitoxin system PemK/MazF family toxin [Isosphaeraceae bacterium]
MIRPGEVYLADFEEMGPHPVVVISRDELNRGNWVSAVLITSQRFEERSKQPNCVPLRAGEFGLSRDCVAQSESLFSIRRAELGEHLGTLDDERWRELVKAVGNMMGSDCEPG